MPYLVLQCMQQWTEVLEGGMSVISGRDMECALRTSIHGHTHMRMVTNTTAVFTQSSEGEMPATLCPFLDG